MEEQVEAWIAGLWDPLKEIVKLVESGSTNAQIEPVQPVQETISTPAVEVPVESVPVVPLQTIQEPTPTPVVEARAVPIPTEPVSKKPAPKKKIQIKQIPDVPKNVIELVATSADPVAFSEIYGPERRDCHPLKITSARWLTTKNAIKQTVEISFDLPSDFPEYLPGDSLAIHAPNNFVKFQTLFFYNPPEN